ncbi:MAG TPA: ABC transporter permease [Alphaproteobacteria bacterium]|nr:ABC transporter permease [Alphaproteobacteria bacterium]
MLKAWRRFATHRPGLAGGAFVLLLALAGVAAPLLAPADPSQIGNQIMLPPSLQHLMGTDELGRDVLSGVIYGIRVSLTVGFLAALAASLLGAIIGALAGFYGGFFDLLVMRISEVFQVVPSFILAAVIVALSGAGLMQIVAVIALLAWPQTARVMRGEVLRIKRLEFVDAVRCLGIGEGAILAGEIVPNALAPMLAVGTLIVGQAILLEAALSFFGLGSADVVSWGRMLNSGQRFLFNGWWLSFFPGTAIFLTVLAFNLLGDAIGAVFNPRSAA